MASCLLQPPWHYLSCCTETRTAVKFSKHKACTKLSHTHQKRNIGGRRNKNPINHSSDWNVNVDGWRRPINLWMTKVCNMCQMTCMTTRSMGVYVSGRVYHACFPLLQDRWGRLAQLTPAGWQHHCGTGYERATQLLTCCLTSISVAAAPCSMQPPCCW